MSDQPKSTTPVQYKVVDQQYSPGDPTVAQELLTAQGLQGWQLNTVYPDPRRERTRWIFSNAPSGTGGGGDGAVHEAPVEEKPWKKRRDWTPSPAAAGQRDLPAPPGRRPTRRWR
jgi:hypothetical protein